MPDSRFIQDQDYNQWQILHHTEAFLMISYPVTYKQFDKEQSSQVVNQTYDETDIDPLFMADRTLQATYEVKPTKEKLEDYGVTEMVDCIVFMSRYLLTQAGIIISNRDHFVIEGIEYSVIENDITLTWDNREFEQVVTLREFGRAAT